MIFQGVSLTGNSDSFVSDGVCKQHNAPRACITCHTRNFSCRAQPAQDDRGILLDCSLCVFLESQSISFMFHSSLCDPQLSSHFSTFFVHLHQVRLPLLPCYTRRCVHPLPLRNEGYALARWLHNPLASCEQQTRNSTQSRCTWWRLDSHQMLLCAAIGCPTNAPAGARGERPSHMRHVLWSTLPADVGL